MDWEKLITIPQLRVQFNTGKMSPGELLVEAVPISMYEPANMGMTRQGSCHIIHSPGEHNISFSVSVHKGCSIPSSHKLN